jgi:hypothetical protein
LAVVSYGDEAGSEQLSEPVGLDAGKRYYIEVLHKEGDSKDHLSVTWQAPGAPRAMPITGQWLAPWPIEKVEPIRFSVENFFPNEPFALAIEAPTPGATIHYTTDGSWPSPTHGAVYRAPITIERTTVLRAYAFKPNAVSTDVRSRTYVFIDDILSQEDVAPKGAHWSTDMDPDVVRSPVYRDRIGDALLAIPTLSLVTSDEDMFGRGGIYRNPAEKGRDWERRASLELVQPDGRREFEANCGVRISGGRSRVPRASPKHNFRIVFRRKYGPGKLRYRLFPDSDRDRYDGFVLRAGFNHSWTTRTAEKNYAQYLRNAYTRDAHNATGSFNGNGRFVHLYVNGLYWGLYFMEDRQDAAFGAGIFGGSDDDFDVVQDRKPESGRMAAFEAMFAIANRGLASNKTFQELLGYLDLTHFIDYLIVNNFLANYDWPLRNWRAVRKREPGARFQFFTWDAEWTLPHYRPVWTEAGNYKERLTIGDRDKTPGRLFHNLRENAEFRLRFADRLHRHFFNRGPFYVDLERPAWDPAHPERNRPAALYHEWAKRIDEAIIAESARWGDTRREVPFTRDEEWVRERNRILNEWLPSRAVQFLEHCRKEGLYPHVEAPHFAPHGGVVEPGFRVSVAAPAGTIYFTTDGSDPRVPFDGTVSGRSRAYRGAPIPLDGATRLKARVLLDGEWSALNEATFYVRQDWSALQVTEIMYHPPVEHPWEDEDLFEFIELKNINTTGLDLSGLSFTDGIRFTFPLGTVLDPGGFVVLASDGRAFKRFYGLEPSGTYQGRLDNGGERIQLTAPGGQLVVDMTYDDRNGWPGAADGEGRSLVPCRPSPHGNQNEPSHWTVSRQARGSPGADEPSY